MKQKLDTLLKKIGAIEAKQHTMQQQLGTHEEHLNDHESRLRHVEIHFKQMVLNIEKVLPSSALSYGYDEVDQRNIAVDSIPGIKFRIILYSIHSQF